MFGFVGIEADSQEKVAGVRLAKQWKRDEMNSIPNDISAIYQKVKWDLTYADQLVGQHMIRGVERSLGFNVAVITTQKNLKDPEKVELVKVMDMTEITQLALSLKQNHNIIFFLDELLCMPDVDFLFWVCSLETHHTKRIITFARISY